MQKRRPQHNAVFTVLTAIFAVLFTASLTVAIVFVIRYQSQNDAMSVFAQQADSQSDDAALALDSLKSQLDTLQSQADSLAAEKAELIKSFSDSDERYKQLTNEVTELQAQLDAKQAEIDKLNTDIEKLGGVYKVDINAQFGIIEQLETLLKTGAPMKKVTVTETDASGAETEVTTEVYPTISLYYQDIERGYTYSYNDSQVYYAASCLKAPFALAILQAATDEADAIASGSAAEKVYDFEQTYTYTKADSQSGSGVIIDSADGTVYTYRQLIELMLTQSDNVAFNQLKKKYGTSTFWTLVSKLGTTAMKKDLATMTASDGGKVMAAIYKFMQSDSPYAQFMYDAMTTSNHRVMIPSAVSGKVVAHKYGWDTGAYHDMGIVFDKNPYVVVILTDFDIGGTEVDNYIRSVIKLVDKLHENFYK
jgi:Beta-lactamase class A